MREYINDAWLYGGVDTLWEYDDVIFDSVIRRSGGSLVITIPPELKRRFMLNEGQPVRLIGVIRKGLHIEGGILIYFGRFEIIEEAIKVTFEARKKDAITENDIKQLSELFKSYDIAKYDINQIDENSLKIELTISSIKEGGATYITRADVDRILESIKDLKYTIRIIKEEKETLKWHDVDPSNLVRYIAEPLENIKTKWILK